MLDPEVLAGPPIIPRLTFTSAPTFCMSTWSCTASLAKPPAVGTVYFSSVTTCLFCKPRTPHTKRVAALAVIASVLDGEIICVSPPSVKLLKVSVYPSSAVAYAYSYSCSVC